MRKFRIVAIIYVSIFAQTLFAQDYNKGLDAYNSNDYQTALTEWLPLAERGDANAQRNLGQMYRNGEGVPKDDIEAVRWYKLAADQGDVNAQYNLGVMYGNGVGVPKDVAEAGRWYKLAAEQGNAGAQFILGLMYDSGEGVPQDEVLAYMWHNLSAALGMTDAAKERDAVAAKLTPEQLAEAQRLSRTCLQSNYKECGF